MSSQDPTERIDSSSDEEFNCRNDETFGASKNGDLGVWKAQFQHLTKIANSKRHNYNDTKLKNVAHSSHELSNSSQNDSKEPIQSIPGQLCTVEKLEQILLKQLKFATINQAQQSFHQQQRRYKEDLGKGLDPSSDEESDCPDVLTFGDFKNEDFGDWKAQHQHLAKIADNNNIKLNNTPGSSRELPNSSRNGGLQPHSRLPNAAANASSSQMPSAQAQSQTVPGQMCTVEELEQIMLKHAKLETTDQTYNEDKEKQAKKVLPIKYANTLRKVQVFNDREQKENKENDDPKRRTNRTQQDGDASRHQGNRRNSVDNRQSARQNVLGGRMSSDNNVTFDSVTESKIIDPATLQIFSGKTYNFRMSRRAKTNLFELEVLYTIFIDVEEKVMDRASQALLRKQADLLDDIVTAILIDNQLTHFLSVRNGKIFLLRVLSHLTTDVYAAQLLVFWIKFFLSLPFILHGDSIGDNILPRFHSQFKRFINVIEMDHLLEIVSNVTEVANFENDSESPLHFIVSNEFGISAIASLLQRVHKLLDDCTETQTNDWTNFLTSLVDTLNNVGPAVPSPIEAISIEILTRHLDKHGGRLTIDKRQLLEKTFLDSNN